MLEFGGWATVCQGCQFFSRACRAEHWQVCHRFPHVTPYPLPGALKGLQNNGSSSQHLLTGSNGAGRQEAPPRTLVTALRSPGQMFLEPFPRLDCQTAPRQAEGLATRQDTSHNKGSNHRATAVSKGTEGPGLAG